MAIFSRRHYQAIAEVVKDVNSRTGDLGAIETLAEDLCDMFLRDNEEFNTKRFLKVCGMGE